MKPGQTWLRLLGVLLLLTGTSCLLPLQATAAEEPQTPAWQARFNHWQARQISSDGSGPNPQDYMQAYYAIQKMRRGADRLTMEGEGWSPIGPYGPALHLDPNHISGAGRINCVTFHPTDVQTLWVGVGQGGIWRSSDGGQNWMPLGDQLPILRISDIAVDPRDTDVLYVSLGDYAYLGADLEHQNRKRHTHYGMGVYKSSDGGLSWAPTGLTFVTQDRDGTLIRRVLIDPRDSRRLTALGSSGIFHSTDAGETWSSGELENIIWDVEVNPTDSSEIYVSSGYLAAQNIGRGGLYKSNDYGMSWRKLEISPWPNDRAMQRIEIAVAPSQPNRVYALACNLQRTFFGLIRSDDRGESWENVDVSPQNILGGSSGSGNDNRGQGTYDLYLEVDPQNHDCIYAGGINSWKSADAGRTFEALSYWRGDYGASVHADHHFMDYNPLDQQFYLCHDGGLDRTPELIAGSWLQAVENENYTWPTQWENLSQAMAITSFYRLGVNPLDQRLVIAGAQDNATFIRRENLDWFNVFGGDGMDCQFADRGTQTIFGSLQYAQLLYFSRDLGLNERRNSSRVDDLNDFGEWVSPLKAVPGTDDEYIIAKRQIYKFRLQGEGIQGVRISEFGSLDSIGFTAPSTAFDLSYADPDVMYVAKRLDFLTDQPIQVFRTLDGGQVWTDVSAGLPEFLYVTDMEVHPRDPMIAWLTLGGYDSGQKVYETRDGGVNWDNISANLPNLPVNCVVQDSSSLHNDLYVGADLGIYVRNDQFPEWRLYTENIPNVIVSDLAIHVKSSKIFASTFGRGIWEAPLADLRIPSDIAEDQAGAGQGAGTEISAPRIFPNPGSQFNISLPARFLPGGQSDYQIVDVMGRQVQAGILTMPRAELRLQAGISPGVYYLRLQGGAQQAALRFVFQP